MSEAVVEDNDLLLDSRQMARFVARGFLRLDAVVPAHINAAFLAALGQVDTGDVANMRSYYGRIMTSGAIPAVPAGVPLAAAYPEGSPLADLLALPRVRDFRGISGRAFDGRGNYNIGVKEQIIFPEIEYDKVDALRGLNISITTTAKSDEECKALLTAFRFPFKN
jgi:hypothetical protein